MSSVGSSPMDVRRFQSSADIMQSIKKKAIASFHNSTTSEDQPLDFSTKKTATPCQDSGLRQTTDIRSPAIADHPMQAVRHDSPEESILNNMQFRASPSSSPDSLSPSPPMSQLQQLPPSPVPSTTGASSPNGLVTNGMSGRLEEMSLPSHAQRYLAPFVYPVPTALLTPSPQYLTVDTTQGVNGVNHSSPVALDSKLMHYQRMYPHFAPMNGHVSPEYLNGINGDSSVSSLIIPAEKKGTKATRPFNIYPNNSLLPNIPDMFSYPIGSAMRDQELRFAQYTEQCILPKRRVANGQVKNGESKPTTADKNSKGEEPMQTDSNSNSSDFSPAVNGNGPAAVTSTGPSTSEQIPKRKNRALPEELKDEAYWERRRKNNEAAKRSRDARRAKEDEIAMRCSFLQSENMKLRAENETLRLHLASLTSRIGR